MIMMNMMKASKAGTIEKCWQCGKDYEADGSSFKYCSQDCADDAYDDYIEGMTEAYVDDLHAINEEYRKEKDYL